MAKSKKAHRKAVVGAKVSGLHSIPPSKPKKHNSTRTLATATGTATDVAPKPERVRPAFVSHLTPAEEAAIAASVATTEARLAALVKKPNAAPTFRDLYFADPIMRRLEEGKDIPGMWANIMNEENARNPRPRSVVDLVSSIPLPPSLPTLRKSNSVVKTNIKPAVKGTKKRTGGHQILVGNLPPGITAQELTAVFGNIGTVTDIHIPIDPASKRTRGIAFITFAEADAILAALAMESVTFYNRIKKRHDVATIQVAEGKRKGAKEMKARKPE